MNFLHIHSINLYLHRLGITIQDECMVFPYGYCDYPLSHIDKTCFLLVLECFSPSGEEARFKVSMFVGAGAEIG